MKAGADSCAAVDALLLEYAYGELEGAPRRELEAHLASCPHCRAELVQLADTRRAMAALLPETPSDAGLESLLAYAEQSARQRAVAPRAWWPRWLVPALSFTSVAAVLTVMVSRPLEPARQLAPVPVPALEPSPVVHAEKRAGTPKPMAATAPEVASPAVALAASAREEEAPDQIARASPTAAPLRKGSQEAPGASGAAGEVAEAKRDAPERSAKKAVAQPPEAPVARLALKSAPRGAAGGATDDAPAKVSDEDHGARRRVQEPEEAMLGGALENADRAADKERAIEGTRLAEVMSNVSPFPAPSAPVRPPPPAQPAAKAKAERSAREDSSELAAADRVATRAEGKAAPAKDSPVDGSPETLLAAARERLLAGDAQGAERVYARFLERFSSHPRAPEAALARASLLEQLQRPEEARALRAEIARRWPGAGASGPRGAASAPARARAAPLEKAADFEADSAAGAASSH